MAAMTVDNGGVFGSKSDDEINNAWKLVEDRVMQMAGGDRSKINPNLTIDNVMQYLDQAQSTDKKAADAYGEIKKIFHRTLQCIETVGGIVANGASYAFGPATTCYSALTFVISAWRGYEGIFESLASLLGKCTEFLDRLSYYAQSGMDTKLTKVACSHLHLFVEICDRSLKLKSKRHKLAAFMKQMFLNDDGVQDLLGAMKSLIDKERGLVAAQTWKSSNDAATYSKDGLNLTRKMHNSIVEDKSLLKREKDLEKWKKAIVNALDLDQKLLLDDVPDWEKAWKRHKSKIIEGSGEWLTQDSRFKEWVAGTNPSSRILGLEGRDGAGKTLLASNVILHLRRIKDIGSSRVVVAHNFLESDSKSSTPTDKVMAMSRNLICQLAFSDEPYMKSVAAICENSMSFESPLEMWTQLLLQNEDLQNIDVSFFLILDGLGSKMDALTHILQKFSNTPLIQKTRILLTGQENTFHDIRMAGGVDIEKIILGEPNKPDIELYINHRMGNMEMLSDESRAHVSEIREKILSSLIKSTFGDFYKINRVLDNIATTDDVEEINAFLETAGDTRPDQIEAEIEALNQTRTAKEISEINEIILWIWAGFIWLSPIEMEAALELKALGAGNAGGASLLSMQSKIRTKYTLFSIDYNKVDFKVGEMLDKIPYKKIDTRDDNESSTSGFKDIQPAEINIVQHYLNAVCPPDLYQKFGFEEFFKHKMVRKRSYIYQDRDNGHVAVVIRCLTCLVEKRNEKTESLLQYTAGFLNDHMEAADLSLADRSLKSEAGALLVRLFTEQYAIDSLLGLRTKLPAAMENDYAATDTMGPWLFDKSCLDVLRKWLNDSAVIEKVKDHPFITAFKAQDANQGILIVEPALKAAANELFIKPTSRQTRIRCFVLICYVLSMENEDFNFDLETMASPTLEMFQSVEKRALEILSVTEKSSMWEGRAASLLLNLPGDQIPKSAALETAQRALALDSDNWIASYVLYRASDDSNQDTSTLEGLVERLKTDAEWREDQVNEENLAYLLFELGDKYWDDEGNQEKAVAAYSQVLELKRTTSILAPFLNVLRSYTLTAKWDEIVYFLEELVRLPEDDEHIAGSFIANGLVMDPWLYCPVFSRVTEARGRHDLLEALLKKVELAKGKLQFQYWNKVRVNIGSVLAEIKGREDEGIEVWERIIRELSPDGFTLPVRDSTENIVRLCTALAAAGGVSQEKLEAYDKKVIMCKDILMADSSQPTELYGPYVEYFQVRGKLDIAKQIARGPAKEALEMLYDDDIENDSYSFFTLGVLLSALRDFENNDVSWYMTEQSKLELMAEYERKMTSWDEMMAAGHELDESTKPEKPSMTIGFCDGDCDRLFETADGFWVCLMDNARMLYCEDCYALLQDGKLDMKFGGKCRNHEHKHYVQDKEKLAAVPKGSVLVGDRTITLEEWKQEIKAKYVEFDKLE